MKGTPDKRRRKPPMVKFRFLVPEDEGRVLMPLMRQSKVIPLKEGDSEVFIVPRKSLKVMDNAGVEYEVLEEMAAYSALLALRSAIVNHVQ